MVIRPQTFDGLINIIYNSIADAGMNPRAYFSQPVILAARNDNIAEINTAILNMVPVETYELLNADIVDDEESANVVLTEFLS